MEHFEVAQRAVRGVRQRRRAGHEPAQPGRGVQALDLPEQALIHPRRALELSEELGDRQLQATALNNLGWMYSNEGD
jgi:hypothetical protein